MNTYSTSIDTPAGTLWLSASERGLCSIDFTDPGHPDAGAGNSAGNSEASKRHLDGAVDQLRGYFSGARRDFDINMDLSGSAFQQAVWQQLQRVGYGTTSTYADIARAIGKPRAVRAVGRCCALNPIPFVIPCHRILGSNGNLTGYRGGLDFKRRVLNLEGCL